MLLLKSSSNSLRAHAMHASSPNGRCVTKASRRLSRVGNRPAAFFFRLSRKSRLHGHYRSYENFGHTTNLQKLFLDASPLLPSIEESSAESHDRNRNKHG
jgi:hypothetical protein